MHIKKLKTPWNKPACGCQFLMKTKSSHHTMFYLKTFQMKGSLLPHCKIISQSSFRSTHADNTCTQGHSSSYTWQRWQGLQYHVVSRERLETEIFFLLPIGLLIPLFHHPLQAFSFPRRFADLRLLLALFFHKIFLNFRPGLVLSLPLVVFPHPTSRFCLLILGPLLTLHVPSLLSLPIFC